MKTAIFRVDASPTIGGGHVTRCLALADALAEAGWHCGFACRPGTWQAVPALGQSVHDRIELDCAPPGEADVLATKSPRGPDLLVVDHYQRDADFEARCRPWARRILAIDDLADRRHDCDLLLDQTLGHEAEDYAGLLPEGCRLLLGPAYALLRPQFAAMRHVALAHREKPAAVRRILVQLGTGDPDNATGMVLDGISGSGIDAGIDVLMGAAAPHLNPVRSQAADLPQEARMHVDTAEVADLMTAADLAIGAGGTASWERCCLGLPTLLMEIADNQRQVAARLQAAGAAVLLGPAKSLTPRAVAEAVQNLAADSKVRETMARAGATICDGLGARRVLSAIEPESLADGVPIELRPATRRDERITFSWQCDPETRRYFRNPQIPTSGQHADWLAAKLGDANCLLNIILVDGEPAGVLRLDRHLAKAEVSPSYNISILVAPELGGRGVGTAALAAARRLVPDAEIIAEVDPENAASHRLFRKAGFLPEGGTYRRPPPGEPM